ncbi:MAG TPA: hypothetical protein VJY42_03145 [Candidatus Methanomethylophilaceae archaeon]|nr:hypothetical protein [Candidatus Methanomethylophilaceae archaeon]
MAKNYNWLWAGLNIIGIILAVVGMFGVIGILNLNGSMVIFSLGTTLILLSIAIIFYNAFKLGLLKEPDKENKENCNSKYTDKERE